MAKEKKKRKWLKVTLIVLGSIIGALVVGIGGYNGIKYWRFSEFYGMASKVRTNPGLNDGFITQGLCYLPDDDIYITSGYMTNGNASRIYSVDKDNNIRFTELYEKTESGAETAFKYHCGGISCEGDYIYVASDCKINVFRKTEVLNDDKAYLVKSVTVNNNASFVFTTDTYLYVGEFNDSKNYVCENTFTDEATGVTTNAIVTKYYLANFNFNSVLGTDVSVPITEYAIRDQVQGFCITDSGKFVMDTSWGPSASNYYVYEIEEDAKPDAYDDLTPVYYLNEARLKRHFTGPSMAEDLDYHGGKVYVTSESASNKYIYGKLFFYNYIYGLSIE